MHRQALSRLIRAFFLKYLIFKSINHYGAFNRFRGMSWISVVNSKPEEMQEVIIFDSAPGIVIGFFYPFSNSFIGSVDGTRLTHVSYWMPLPELPVLEE